MDEEREGGREKGKEGVSEADEKGASKRNH
jgi:hypothetical protein